MSADQNRKIKIAVGMSGGVDSSVSALLLTQQGYDVVGLFMKLWHDPACAVSRENACCDEKALADARKVADRIGIPLYVVDAREPFKKAVTDYFIDEYKNLRTPNPCVVCNKAIKFGWLIDFAEKIGCSYLATGHYARIVAEKPRDEGTEKYSHSVISTPQELRVEKSSQKDLSTNARDDKFLYRLLKGKDLAKDQTYFLYQLNQRQLSKIIFPVGEMTKSEVRAIAKKNKLPVFEKVESQDVCFIGEKDYHEFLRRHLDKKYFERGNIVDSKGKIIGKHDGLVNYTIGQRRGISQVTRNKEQGTSPLFVIGFDRERNELIAGEDKELFRSEFEVRDMHWIDQELGVQSSKFEVKVRYRAKAIPCTISELPNSKFEIRSDEPVRALTPGQSAVLYSGDEVVGGGIISA